MEYSQLKVIEGNISACQAKLGLFRAELKRDSETVNYDDLKKQIGQLEREVDELQRKYIAGKDAMLEKQL